MIPPRPLEISFAKIKTVPLSFSLKEKAKELLVQLLHKVNVQQKRTFTMPTISFDLRGKAAGMAHYNENHVQYNPVLFAENADDFLATTVPHELAHILVWQKYGPKADGHGTEWKAAMRLLGAVPNRTHSFDVANAAVGQQFSYLCACRTHFFGVKKHRDASRGTIYTCKTCKKRLVLQSTAKATLPPRVTPPTAAPYRPEPLRESLSPPSTRGLATKGLSVVPANILRNPVALAAWLKAKQ